MGVRECRALMRDSLMNRELVCLCPGCFFFNAGTLQFLSSSWSCCWCRFTHCDTAGRRVGWCPVGAAGLPLGRGGGALWGLDTTSRDGLVGHGRGTPIRRGRSTSHRHNRIRLGIRLGRQRHDSICLGTVGLQFLQEMKRAVVI